jgi:hypothetical protein
VAVEADELRTMLVSIEPAMVVDVTIEPLSGLGTVTSPVTEEEVAMLPTT